MNERKFKLNKSTRNISLSSTIILKQQEKESVLKPKAESKLSSTSNIIKKLLKVTKKNSKCKTKLIKKKDEKENRLVSELDLISFINSKTTGLLPEKSITAPKYTLVLDMDETLIHYVNALDESRFEVAEDEDLCFYT